MKTFKQFKKDFLKDEAKKKVYEALEVESKIYNAIVAARIEKKWTQKQLAENIGVAQSALARFESGRTNPTPSFLQKVTAGLGLKITII